jgi:hypothetical protein
MERSAIPCAATTSIDEVADGDGRYVAERNRQDSAFLNPDVRPRSELPNLIRHRGVNPETAEDIEFVVVEDGETTWQSYPVRVAGPWSSNALDYVSRRVITEHAVGSCRLSAC